MSTNNASCVRNRGLNHASCRSALPLVAKPEAGPTVAAYFRAKHARGDRGRFRLHQIESWQRAGTLLVLSFAGEEHDI
jgi:hypothetical protein